MLPDDGFQTTTLISGLMPDSFGEMFNFLDGDSFGIGMYNNYVPTDRVCQTIDCDQLVGRKLIFWLTVSVETRPTQPFLYLIFKLLTVLFPKSGSWVRELHLDKS